MREYTHLNYGDFSFGVLLVPKWHLTSVPIDPREGWAYVGEIYRSCADTLVAEFRVPFQSEEHSQFGDATVALEAAIHAARRIIDSRRADREIPSARSNP